MFKTAFWLLKEGLSNLGEKNLGFLGEKRKLLVLTIQVYKVFPGSNTILLPLNLEYSNEIANSIFRTETFKL